MFKEGDIVTYTVPSHGMVSAVQYNGVGNYPFQRPDTQSLNGITAIVEYAEYSNRSPNGWGYICSGNYQIAVSCNDLTRYSGIIKPELLKRSW
jgi:hypothetical protein